MKSLGLRLVVGIAVVLAAACANASGHLTPGGLQEGPGGEIETLTEEQFYVDGTASSARVFTFSNRTRSLHFIPMIHQAELAFYEAVAGEVKHLKAQGTQAPAASEAEGQDPVSSGQRRGSPPAQIDDKARATHGLTAEFAGLEA